MLLSENILAATTNHRLLLYRFAVHFRFLSIPGLSYFVTFSFTFTRLDKLQIRHVSNNKKRHNISFFDFCFFLLFISILLVMVFTFLLIFALNITTWQSFLLQNTTQQKYQFLTKIFRLKVLFIITV